MYLAEVRFNLGHLDREQTRATTRSEVSVLLKRKICERAREIDERERGRETA